MGLVTEEKARQTTSHSVLVGSEYRYNVIHVANRYLIINALSQGCQI